MTPAIPVAKCIHEGFNVVRPSDTSAQFAIRLNGIILCAVLNYISFCAYYSRLYMLLIKTYLLFQKLC